MKHPIKFGMIISGILNTEMKYIEPYTKDVYKLFLEYAQPMLYMYGSRDPLKKLIENGIVEEGDYTIIHHKYGHNLPRLVGPELEKLVDFIKKVGFECLGEEIKVDKDIFEESIKERFLKETTGHSYLLSKL